MHWPGIEPGSQTVSNKMGSLDDYHYTTNASCCYMNEVMATSIYECGAGKRKEICHRKLG